MPGAALRMLVSIIVPPYEIPLYSLRLLKGGLGLQTEIISIRNIFELER